VLQVGFGSDAVDVLDGFGATSTPFSVILLPAALRLRDDQGLRFGRPVILVPALAFRAQPIREVSLRVLNEAVISDLLLRWVCKPVPQDVAVSAPAACARPCPVLWPGWLHAYETLGVRCEGCPNRVLIVA